MDEPRVNGGSVTPEKGQRGSRFKDRLAKSAADATSRTRSAAERVSDRMQDVSFDVGQAASDLVIGVSDRPSSVSDEWGVGLARVFRSHPKLPSVLNPVVDRLDRLGALSLTERSLSIDGQDVPWDRITSITSCSALQMLATGTLDREMQRFGGHLRLLPGRRWLALQMADIVAAVFVAVTMRGSQRESDSDAGSNPVLQRPVLAKITYQGKRRQEELVPGLFATLVLAANPRVFQGIVDSAARYSIPVTSSPPHRALGRGQSIQAVASSLRARFTNQAQGIPVAQDPSAPAVPARDIPPLHPAFYREMLHQTGKPETDDNIASVAQLTAMNLALNAHVWFETLGDSLARERFNASFNQEKNAARLERTADDMIDFLWEWTPRAHAGLRDFVEQMRGTIASAVSRYGDRLPEDMWSDE